MFFIIKFFTKLKKCLFTHFFFNCYVANLFDTFKHIREMGLVVNKFTK